MFKAIAIALLMTAAMPAAANPNDPCIAESRQVGSIAQARDHGVNMQALLKENPPEKFADAEEHEFYLRLMALAYGNPEWTEDDLKDAVYQACFDR